MSLYTNLKESVSLRVGIPIPDELCAVLQGPLHAERRVLHASAFERAEQETDAAAGVRGGHRGAGHQLGLLQAEVRHGGDGAACKGEALR